MEEDSAVALVKLTVFVLSENKNLWVLDTQFLKTVSLVVADWIIY